MTLRIPEYDDLDALALGELVARRQLSAPELLEAALERADERNPRLNAIVARYDDEARARARGPLPDGPLSGVPFLFKDLLALWKGHPATASCRLFEGFVAPEDAEVVRRLLGAGLVPFGQTNTPELGIMGTTEPAWRGPTRNPWDLGRSSGGSSGGSAAAVASRIVPAAHGNDGGGSIRIPASACGLFGMKATRGRVSFAPYFGEVFSGYVSEGVLTRSVRDSAAFLDVLAGPVPGDPYPAPPQARPYSAEVATPPGRLRIAVTHDPFFNRTTAPESRDAVLDAARLLSGLGHDVVEARPAFDRDALVHAYLVCIATQTAVDAALAERATGRRAGWGLLEPETLGLAVGGAVLSARDLVLAQQEIQRAARSVAAFFAEHDVLVTPATARPALPIGASAITAFQRLGLRLVSALRSRPLLERYFHEIGGEGFEATGYTMLFNQTGQPAMSVPLHWTPEGLPLGVQVVGAFGDEATLFRLAGQLEQARPWAARRPPGFAAAAGAARAVAAPTP
jgi:amidase